MEHAQPLPPLLRFTADEIQTSPWALLPPLPHCVTQGKPLPLSLNWSLLPVASLEGKTPVRLLLSHFKYLNHTQHKRVLLQQKPSEESAIQMLNRPTNVLGLMYLGGDCAPHPPLQQAASDRAPREASDTQDTPKGLAVTVRRNQTIKESSFSRWASNKAARPSKKWPSSQQHNRKSPPSTHSGQQQWWGARHIRNPGLHCGCCSHLGAWHQVGGRFLKTRYKQ